MALPFSPAILHRFRSGELLRSRVGTSQQPLRVSLASVRRPGAACAVSQGRRPTAPLSRAADRPRPRCGPRGGRDPDSARGGRLAPRLAVLPRGRARGATLHATRTVSRSHQWLRSFAWLCACSCGSAWGPLWQSLWRCAKSPPARVCPRVCRVRSHGAGGDPGGSHPPADRRRRGYRVPLPPRFCCATVRVHRVNCGRAPFGLLPDLTLPTPPAMTPLADPLANYCAPGLRREPGWPPATWSQWRSLPMRRCAGALSSSRSCAPCWSPRGDDPCWTPSWAPPRACWRTAVGRRRGSGQRGASTLGCGARRPGPWCTALLGC